MKKKIWLASPHMSEEGYEMEYIKEAFETNWIAPLGENVDKFEKELANMVGIDYSAALSSGTAAIHLALKACGIKENDLVICPSLTFAGTVNPILYLGAKPVFVDSDYETWNMDPDLLEAALKKYPETKAVIVVHLYGISADLDRIVEICKKHNVILIEDAAESLGTKYKGKYTGTYGDYGIYSFNGNKIITCSGGGMLVSNDKAKIEKTKFWATQARDKARHYQHSELGYNYRLSNVLAGIGRGQLKVLNKRIVRKREIFNIYKNELNDYMEFMPMNEFDYSNCWLSCALLKKEPLKLIEELEKNNIESRPIWKPMHMQPLYKEYEAFGRSVSEDIYNRGICLPSDTKLEDEDIINVTNIIKTYMDRLH